MSARSRAIAVLLPLVGCAVGPDFQRPVAPTDQRFTVEPTPPNMAQSNRLAADWWHLLHCPALDTLVVDAWKGNPGLESAEATLRKSQDALRAGYGIFSPQLDGSAGASRQQSSPQRFGLNTPSTVFNLFTLSATVSYALDIWGGQRRTVEGLRAQMEAQRDQVLGTRLMLAGNVVNTVIASAAYQAEIDATRQLLALQEDQVRLAETQAKAGTIPYANVLGLKSQLALTRTTLPPLEQKIDQARHLLATLLGRAPGQWSPSPIALGDLTLPDAIPLSLPSQLVRQRPDILIAEEQLHGATAQIGVATSALLPSLTLTGTLGANNTSLGDLFSSSSLFWSLGAGLAQPLFHGGTLWYQRKEALDARDAALANYRQTVLAAFAQVADALRGLTHDADALAAQKEALAAADQSVKLVEINYESGLANYLQVLTADTQYLQAKMGYIEVQAQQLQDTVALFVALGGGWWNEDHKVAANAERR